MRICSFLPSATEILCALGMGESLAGVTYECDHPPEARGKPVVVHTRLPHFSGSAEIHQQVSEFMSRGESLYRVDLDELRKIEPDLIVTQDLCRVCAASPGDLNEALACLPRTPRVLCLNPRGLADVWGDIRMVGAAAGRAAEGEALARDLERRVAAVGKAVASTPVRPRVLALEWLDPPFIAGHWVPEMVACAGGIDVLGKAGEPGFQTTWDKVLNAKPEVIVVMPCGYHLPEVLKEFRKTQFPSGWGDLPAVRNGKVYAVDASSYYSRPGPRLAAGVEVLADILHPGCASAPPPRDAVERVA